MTILATIVLLVSGAGTIQGTRPAPSAADDALIRFNRICNIEPGQDIAAEALARRTIELGRRKYPGAQMAAETGRWMTGFQEIANPVNQILFAQQHADVETYEAFIEILEADEEFQALQRHAFTVIDPGSCVETRAPR